MTQFVSPYKESPLVAAEVLEWLRNLRAGVISGFEVSAGTTGYRLDINSGYIRALDGTVIHDDLTKIDVDAVISRGSGDEHFTIWATYSYTDTVPAAALQITSSKATPPALPAAPVNSIRICDIFIPSAATDILDANIRFVNAPRQPANGASGDALLDLIARGAESFTVFSENAISYDDAAGEIAFSSDMIIQSLAHSHQQRFNQAPLARVEVPTAQSPFTVPGSVGARDAILYVEIDRTSPSDLTSPPTATLKAVDLTNVTAPGDANLADFQDPTKVYNLAIIGHVYQDKMFLAAKSGGVPAAGGVVGQALIENPLATINFQSLQDIWMHGGFRVVLWDDGTYADVDTALNAEVPAALRKNRMVVRAFETNNSIANEKFWDGAGWQDWVPENSLITDLGILSGFAPTTPNGAAEISLSAGELIAKDATRIETTAASTVAITSDDDFIIVYDSSDSSFKAVTSTIGANADQLPIAFCTRTAGVIRKLVDIRRWATGNYDPGKVTIGDVSINANFASLQSALGHLSALDVRDERFKLIEVIAKESSNVYDINATAGPGTVDITAGGSVTGNGTSLLQEYDVGDVIEVGANYAVVATVVADDGAAAMTLTGWAGGGVSTQAYNRLDSVGPHKRVYDAALAEYDSTRLAGITIRGVSSKAGSENPILQWGDAAYDAHDPLFKMSNANDIAWTIEKLGLAFVGIDDTTRGEHTVFYDAGKGLNVLDVDIDGGDALSSLAQWETAADFGSGAVRGTLFDRVRAVNVYDDNDGVVSAAAAFVCTVSSSGRAHIRKLHFRSTEDFDRLVRLNGGADTSHIIIEDPDVEDVDLGIFRSTVDYATCRKEVIGGRFGPRSGSGNFRMDSTQDQSVRVDGTHFDLDILLFGINQGANMSIGAFAININDTAGFLSNCDWSRATSITDDGEGVSDVSGYQRWDGRDYAVLGQTGVTALAAIGRETAGAVPGQADSIVHVYKGLFPDITGTDEAQARLVGPFSAVFPDGQVGHRATDLTLDLDGALDLSVDTAVVNDSLLYFFARRALTGVNVDALRCSTTPPQADGAIGVGEAEAGGYTDDHYRYVGFLRVADIIGGGASATWGGCFVVNDSSGRRLVRRGGATAFYQVTGDTTIGTSGTDDILYDPANVFPTGIAFETSVRIEALDSTLTASAFAVVDLDSSAFGVQAGNFEVRAYADQDTTGQESRNVAYGNALVPRQNGGYEQTLTLTTTGGGNAQGLATVQCLGVHEDINMAIPHNQDNGGGGAGGFGP